MNTREFANQELFAPLGIPAVEASDWWTDPQGFSNGGYGLYLRPVDLAKFAYLYLQNGKWEGQQILPERWVADLTIQYVQKPEGPGYGYLWTVYPKTDQPDHFAALGLAGQQVHIYPSRNSDRGRDSRTRNICRGARDRAHVERIHFTGDQIQCSARG